MEISFFTIYCHPCEILGDLQFIRRYRGSLDELNVVFVGEMSNMCLSWFEAAVCLPISVTQVAPVDYLADQKLLYTLNTDANGYISASTELTPLLLKADLIYTDCWPQAESSSDRKRIRERFLPYQITAGHLRMLHEKAMFLPCPPVTRGEEVSVDAMKSPLSMNFQAKNYLLHSQNAVLEYLFSDFS